MRRLKLSLFAMLAILLGFEVSATQAGESVLTAIPDDALAFVVIHNLSDTSRSIGELAKLVQAPAPDLLTLAKQTMGLQKGVDEHGDLAIVLTTLDPVPKSVVLVPLSDSEEFFTSLNVKDPASGIVEVQLAGKPALVGRKGNFAAFAMNMDGEALEQFLASTAASATDAPLSKWLDANKASIVVTTKGVKELLPKLIGSIRAIQAQMRQLPGPAGTSGAEAFQMYIDLFTAAEPEVAQFSLGLRIDANQTADLVKQVQFTPTGAWAKWSANAKPASEDLLAGLPADPFVVALGSIVPPGTTDQLMKFSAQIMQKQPQFNLSPEQAKKYAEISQGMMGGLRSMHMLLGVPEAGTGVYGNTLAVMTVDDSQRFIEGYEKSLAGIRKFAEEAKDSAIPAATSRHIKLGETDVLEVTMDLLSMSKLTPAGGPDPQKMIKLMLGSNDKLNVFVAPADEHTVLMVYTSLDHLKKSLEFYKSKEQGLSGNAGVAKVAAALPAGSQLVAYVDVRRIGDFVRQISTATPGGRPIPIPDISDSPPLGVAAKVSEAGVEGHLVVTAETLQAIGEAVAKVRGAVGNPSPPAQ